MLHAARLLVVIKKKTDTSDFPGARAFSPLADICRLVSVGIVYPSKPCSTSFFMGIKEKAIVVGFASVVLAVVSTVHTAPFAWVQRLRFCDNRPESGAISSTEAAGSSVNQRKAGSVWKNLDKKLKEKKQLKD